MGARTATDSPRSRSGAGDAKTVRWKDLPRKDQLVVITLARLSEPLVQTSLQVCGAILYDNKPQVLQTLRLRGTIG